MRAATLALVLALPCAARAASPAEQLAALNAQRAANGIPAGVVERPEWTQGCRAHLAYIAANGGTFTHSEDPGKPGYSAEGAMVAPYSVLTSYEDAFSPAGNAFESAPLHLMQTLAPALTQMGVWGGCATTRLGDERVAAQPSLFTYPGDGAAGVARSVTASELPFVPGEMVGLPEGTTTGPHVFVMSLGTRSGRLTSASLSGPHGPLEVRAVDNETPRLEGYMPPGGMIIPVAALDADTTYTASATFAPSDGTAPLSRTWSFATGSVAPLPTAVGSASTTGSAAVAGRPSDASESGAPSRLRLALPHASGRSVAFGLTADRLLVGRRARVGVARLVRVCGAGGCRTRQLGRTVVTVIGHLATRQTVSAARPARGQTLRVVVRTQPFVHGGITYGALTTSARWSG